MENSFSRIQIIEKVERAFRTGKSIGFLGPKGVGKSTLVKNWIQNKGLVKSQIRWITITSLRSMNEILEGSANNSLELVLESFAEKWGVYEYIIWDEIHRLPLNQLSLLISFLKNCWDGPKHLLISDENISLLQVELPTVFCDTYSIEETQIYLKNVLKIESLNSENLQKLWKVTGGLPYLINLWSQVSLGNLDDGSFNGSKNIMEESLLAIFQKQDLESLAFVYYRQKVPINETNNLESLYAKFYLLKENGSYTLHSYLKELVEQYFLLEVKKKGATQAILSLKSNAEYDHFLVWWIGISIKEKEISDSECLLFELKKIEVLPKYDLEKVYEFLGDWLSDTRKNNSSISLRKSRLYLQVGILLGERLASLYKLYPFCDQLQLSDLKIDEEFSNFLYEVIYWSNRTENESKAKSYLAFLQNRVQGHLKYLVQLEIAFPFVSSEPHRALIILNRVHEALVKELIVENHNNKKSKIDFEILLKVKAHCLFELAKSNSQLHNRKEALDQYFQAETIYLELGATLSKYFRQSSDIV